MDERILQLYNVLGQTVEIDVCQILMEYCNHDINAAMDEYYSNPRKYEAKKSKKSKSNTNNRSGASNSSNKNDSIDKFFKKYEDRENKKNITVDGVIQLCEDLELDPSSREILILAWQCKCKAQATITKDEFRQGMASIFQYDKNLNKITVQTIAEKLSEINTLIDSPNQKQNFKQLYEFTFIYGKDPTQKSLEIEAAIEYWKMLFSINGNYDNDMIYDGQFPNFSLFENFITFLQTVTMVNEDRPLKMITRDQWSQLLDFAADCQKNIKEHNELSAWPVLIDEYVAWYKEGGHQQNTVLQNNNNNDEEEEKMSDIREKMRDIQDDSLGSNMMF